MRKARLGGCAAALIATAGMAVATAVSYAEPLGHTTEDQTLRPGEPIAPGSSFEQVAEGPADARVVRTLPNASAIGGRGDRRHSLAYFAQLTDFQLVDEESPARVEFTDRGANAAFRPQEAFHPWAIDHSFRQLNQFTTASPHAQAGGARAPMDLALLTGDHADNMQHNEAVWVRQLIEGGTELNPNSGIKSGYDECRPETRMELLAREAAGEIPDEPTYMGVQDYKDLGFKAPDYYDPNEPFGDQYGTFPTWPGLMDRAQSLAFTPVGLRRGDSPVPTFIANGNHDGLVQGNEDAIAAFEDIATGCFKVAQSTATLPIGPSPDPNQLFSPGIGFATRPDGPGRHFLDRVQLKRVYSSGIQGDGHGFGYVDPAELAASGFSATYWARDLKPGIRFISIDTVSEGGVVQESADGNIDDPQFSWLKRELDQAEASGKLVIAFGHHPIRSLTADPPDEAAQHCSGSYDASGNYSNPNEYGHDANPGCDLDPRNSSPIHQGADLRALFDEHPNVIAYVTGHTHENKVFACGSEEGCPEGGNWWEINTSAVSDWPEQSRLIELMENGDGTLSLFGTLTNTAAPVGVPASGTEASGLGSNELASIHRAVTMNDPQLGAGTAEGGPNDRNVELLVDDPRTSTLRGTPGNDLIRGTPGNDLILCGPGDDTVITGDGDDVIRCGPGNDRVFSGRGKDRVSGDSGDDVLIAGLGDDRLFGRTGADHILGQGGTDLLIGGSARDRMLGGRGRDRLHGGDGNDSMEGGKASDRMRGGGGADPMAGGAGGDRMFGGSGRDRLAGQRGNDLLIGGAGRDLLFGGPGRDRRRQ